MTGQSVTFTTKTVGFTELAAASARFEREQQRLLRLNIYDAAKTVVGYVRTEVTSGTYDTDAGMRAGLAKGVKAEVDASASRPGARIMVTAEAMPGGKAPMVKAWEKTTFRHPVFNTGAVVEQAGNPGWFEKTVWLHKDRIDRAVTAAMQQAGATLAGGKA